MGSTTGAADEKPIHTVCLDRFFISQHEVTIWEYLECVKEGQCKMPAWWNREYFEPLPKSHPDKNWLELPVSGVSWEDAMVFCKWKGENFRLPTEAEWEYAARAGSTAEYFWGNSTDSLPLYGNNTSSLLPVKQFKPNTWGVYDMVGNVWEWCYDSYHKSFYEISPKQNPVHVDSSSTLKVARGGHYSEYSWNFTSANRSFGEKDETYKSLGFRVAFSPDKTK
jgi:formylglycine-generating enzyme required for sulfatase activity